MQELFAKLNSPALNDIEITFANGIQAQQARPVIPDLYVGETIVEAFKLSELPSSIIISGKTIYGNYTKAIQYFNRTNKPENKLQQRIVSSLVSRIFYYLITFY